MDRFKYGILGVLIFGIVVLWQTNLLETTKTAQLVGVDNSQNRAGYTQAEIDRSSQEGNRSDIPRHLSPTALIDGFKGKDYNANDTHERGTRAEIAHLGDRTIVKISPYITEEEIALYNEHHIIPFNPIVDTVCQDLPPTDFAYSRSSCEYIQERPKHSYFSLETDELTLLAASDAVASLVLAQKVKDHKERLQWYLRASALSSKSGPLLKLVNRDYQQAFLDIDAKNTGNAGGIIVRLALENVIAHLADTRANPNYWKEHLEGISRENFVDNLQLSNELSAKFLQEMITIQLEVGRTDLLEGAADA